MGVGVIVPIIGLWIGGDGVKGGGAGGVGRVGLGGKGSLEGRESAGGGKVMRGGAVREPGSIGVKPGRVGGVAEGGAVLDGVVAVAG